jgi:hypothetical protein
MKQQVIDSTDGSELFESVETAIIAWEKALGGAELAINEILALRQEISGIDNEEKTLLADHSSNDDVRAKRLGLIRTKRELRQAKLRDAERNLGASGGAVLSRQEITGLETLAAELEQDIKTNRAQETEIFKGRRVGQRLEVGNGLTALRSQRDQKVGKLRTITAQLASHAQGAAFLVNPAANLVQGQLQNLRWQLTERREHEARQLLGLLCTESSEHRWKHLSQDFRSVAEVRLLDVPCPDPAAARKVLAEIKGLWRVQPLARLLDVCEQELAGAAEVALT